MATETELKIASLTEKVEHLNACQLDLLSQEQAELESMIHEYIDTETLDISDPKRLAMVVAALSISHGLIELKKV